MTEINSDRTTGTITIDVCARSNGQYVCQIASSMSDRPNDTMNFYGQTKEHAIAIALEHLADEYREKAEESQNIDSLAVEISDSGEPINKYYHVIVHYEEISEAESKFEAVHNTMMGNTIVENARIAAIEIAPDIEIEPLERSGY
jgi:phosphoribosylformylglycinamidine (FGAM) synthase PurS component